MNKTPDILDEEFNTLTDEQIAESEDLQKALALINKEHIISPLQGKKKLEPEEMFPKVESKVPAALTTNTADTSISQLLEEPELDQIASDADIAFKMLMTEVSGASPKCMAEIASTAERFLTARLQAIQTKVDNRLKREKLALDKARMEMKQKETAAEEEGGITISGMPPVTVIQKS